MLVLLALVWDFYMTLKNNLTNKDKSREAATYLVVERARWNDVEGYLYKADK